LTILIKSFKQILVRNNIYDHILRNIEPGTVAKGYQPYDLKIEQDLKSPPWNLNKRVI